MTAKAAVLALVPLVLAACGGGKAPPPKSAAPASDGATGYPPNPPNVAVADAERTVGGLRASIRKCDDLAKGPPNGSVMVVVKVDPSGAVLSADAAPGPTLPAPVVTCVVKLLASAHFSPRGATEVFNVPIAFEKKGAE